MGVGPASRGNEGAQSSPFQARVSWSRAWERAVDRIGLYRVAVDWSGVAVEADDAFRDVAPYAEGMAENAIRYLHRSGADPLSPEIADRGLVCHGNLHEGNMLRDERGAVRFIDWNRMAWDVRARDIAQWLLYAYGRTGDFDLVAALLKEYQRADRLMEEELCLIYALFLYPHRLMRALDRVYGEQSLPPDQAAFHLTQAVAVEEKKIPLLRRFPDLVREALGRKIPRVDWLEQGSELPALDQAEFAFPAELTFPKAPPFLIKKAECCRIRPEIVGPDGVPFFHPMRASRLLPECCGEHGRFGRGTRVVYFFYPPTGGDPQGSTGGGDRPHRGGVRHDAPPRRVEVGSYDFDGDDERSSQAG